VELQQERILSTDVGRINIKECYASPQKILRGKPKAGDSGEHPFCLIMSVHGLCTFRNNGTDTVFSPGDILFKDISQAFDYEFASPVGHLVLQIPRERIDTPHENSRYWGSVLGSSDTGVRWVNRQLIDIVRHAVQGTATNDESLFFEEHLISLVNTTLKFGPDLNHNQELRERSPILAEQIKQFIAVNASDHSLSVSQISKVFSVSERHIYKCFRKREDSVNEIIVDERLKLFSQLLQQNKGKGVSITDLALKSGFSSHSYAATVFKSRKGVSPRDFMINHSLFELE